MLKQGAEQVASGERESQSCSRIILLNYTLHNFVKSFSNISKDFHFEVVEVNVFFCLCSRRKLIKNKENKNTFVFIIRLLNKQAYFIIRAR